MAEAATNILVAAHNFITGKSGWNGKLKKKGNRVSGRGTDFENEMFGLLTPVGAEFGDVFIFSKDDSPPEGIIRNGGPALEKKHDETSVSKTPLNSSEPYARLHRDDPRISSLIRDSRDWPADGMRDIIYTVGNQAVPKSYRRNSRTGGKKGERKPGSGLVVMAYGDVLTGGDFRARNEWERRVKVFMRAQAEELGLPYALDTNEIFCLKDTDGMGAEERVRRMQSMWHPLKRFWSILSEDPEFTKPVPLWFGVLRTETYDALPKASKDALQPHIDTGDFSIRDAHAEVVVANPVDIGPPYTRITRTVCIKVLRARKSLAHP